LTKAKERAAKLGVTIRPSTRKHKKIDVFNKAGDKIASIGDIRYSDFLQHNDAERRKRYKQRHEGTRHVRGSPSFYADQILW
jgi:hypothetical protein